MNCKICFEKYDANLRKPYSLYPCSHTFCIQCVDCPTIRKCPRCNSDIKDKHPNYDLMEALEEVDEVSANKKRKVLKLSDDIPNEFNLVETKLAKLNLILDFKEQQLVRVKALIDDKANNFIDKIKRTSHELKANVDKILFASKAKRDSGALKYKKATNIKQMLDKEQNIDELMENLEMIKSLNSDIYNLIKFQDEYILNEISNETKIGQLINVKTLRSQSSISCLKVLSNNRIATSGNDNKVRIWSLISYECIRKLVGHTDEVDSLLVLSDERLVSGGADCLIKIWNPNTGECIRTIAAHDDCIWSLVSISDDRIVSGSDDKKIKIWNSNTGECIRTLEGHIDGVVSLAVLSDDRIVSGSRDKTIKIWDSNTGCYIRSLKGNKDDVSALAVLNDERIVSGSVDTTFKIFSTYGGECKQAFKGHTESVNSVVVWTNDRIISASDDHSIKIWNSNTGECIQTLEGHTDEVYSLGVISENQIISGGRDNKIKIWTFL